MCDMWLLSCDPGNEAGEASLGAAVSASASASARILAVPWSAPDVHRPGAYRPPRCAPIRRGTPEESTLCE